MRRCYGKAFLSNLGRVPTRSEGVVRRYPFHGSPNPVWDDARCDRLTIEDDHFATFSHSRGAFGRYPMTFRP